MVALTGAGISTAAGIPDFRGPEGLYATGRYDLEGTFTIGGFTRDPAPFYQFARDFLETVGEIEPTFTHRFLADLERAGTLSAVVTQNIDGLHQRAGSRNVIAVHGDFWSSHCLRCGRRLELTEVRELLSRMAVPQCSCAGLIKPDVVLFGEAVCHLDLAAEAVSKSDLLLVLGSSLAVYPAAFLPHQAGGDVLVVNRGEVELPAGSGRYFVDADLDEFFTAVEKELTLN
jgi:NAD-dependent deacetylase